MTLAIGWPIVKAERRRMLEYNTANLTLWLVGLGVVVLIGLLVVAWYYLKNIYLGISSLSSSTQVFSDSAKSLSLDMKALTLSMSSLSQDIKNLNQTYGDLNQDIKTFNQNTGLLSQNIDNLTGSVNGLISSQNKVAEGLAAVEKMQADAAKSIDRVSKHFSQ
jgi:methyl-accepting chemotaxis protein